MVSINLNVDPLKHRFLRIFSLFLIVAAVVVALCVWRWDIFFGRTTECAYMLPDEPQFVQMGLGENGLADRTFSWSTASPDTSLLRLINIGSYKTDTVVRSVGTQVQTMGGEQYMHVVRLQQINPGTYRVAIDSSFISQPFRISSPADTTLLFAIFGDLLISDSTDNNAIANAIAITSANANVVYTGNILHESTEQNLLRWQQEWSQVPQLMPQIGVPGSRDYDRGIGRVIDPRWRFRFPLPLNGPDRFLGTTAYVDFPLCRLILIDTETLEWLVDYTVLQTWLCRTLQDAGERWKIVVMHHSVHSASAGFDHPRLHAALHPTLDAADLIVSGNDLTYGRRADISLSDLINEQHTVPVYVVLTSDSAESAVPKCSPLDHRIGSNRAFFATLSVEPSSLRFTTRYLNYPDSIYDAFTIDKTTKIVSEQSGLPEEVIELPAPHADSGLRARRFEQLRAVRQSR